MLNDTLLGLKYQYFFSSGVDYNAKRGCGQEKPTPRRVTDGVLWGRQWCALPAVTALHGQRVVTILIPLLYIIPYDNAILIRVKNGNFAHPTCAILIDIPNNIPRNLKERTLGEGAINNNIWCLARRIFKKTKNIFLTIGFFVYSL